MSATERVVLALVILVVDLATVAVPLTAFLAAWVILARPPWFREWVGRLYASPGV